MMNTAKDWIKNSVHAGRGWLRTSTDTGAHRTRKPLTPLMVPICIVQVSQRERIAAHLLALAPEDRYLRFGYAANDEQVSRYVASIDFERDDVFGIFNHRLELVAMAHLAYSGEGERAVAEFGVSVQQTARGRGYGARLFDRAVTHARNRGVGMMLIHALSENAPMLKIARNAGASVLRDGSESEAHLLLPPASLDSRIAEIVEAHFAQVDYSLKKQVQQFWGVWSVLQPGR